MPEAGRLTWKEGVMSKVMLVRLVSLVVGAGLAVAGPGTVTAAGAAGSSVIQASRSCYAGTCTGKDPQIYGCSDDAITIDEFTAGKARIELRYSESCFAAWTRVTVRQGTEPWMCNLAFAQIRAYTTADKRKGVYWVQHDCPGTTWTKMWTFTDFVRACNALGPTADPDECTARH
jgi:hypothetical protein